MSKTYPMALVGEQHYQDNINACSEGDEALVWHEPDNPYDERALAVTNLRGRTLGYLQRDSFAHRALIDEGKGCRAEIAKIEDGYASDFRHVTIEIELLPKHERPIGRRQFTRQ